jgi:hypothetical protein
MEVGTKLIGYEMTIYLLDTLQTSFYLGTPGFGKEILEDGLRRALVTDPHR